MEISHTIIDAIWRPHLLFKQDTLRTHLITLTESKDWSISSLNPRNRINSLKSSTTWRMDGATVCGTHFFPVPLSRLADLVPLRLDLYVPDQNHHPLSARDALNSSLSAPLRDLRMISELGISKHLCRALESYCRRHPEFWAEYARMPFATRLIFEDIRIDVDTMNLTIIPWYEVEQQSRTVATLQNLWKSEHQHIVWPAARPLEKLRLVQQLHDSVSVVCFQDLPRCLYAFKSTVENLDFVYHELKFLLTNPPHPNIMPRPSFIITKRSSFGGKEGVIGFLLPYYSLGSIRDIVPARCHQGTMSLSTKLNWCLQITSAFCHMKKQGTFYSDLRLDNVLLATSTDVNGQDTEQLIMCDFEQRGNWQEWCAPEVLYGQYIDNVRSVIDARKFSVPDRWHKLVEAYMSNKQLPRDVIEAKNRPWFVLPQNGQEKSMVYSLGLFMYCVFEGVSNVRNNVANAYKYESDIEFPTFRQTPPPMQDLIRRCTIDAPEWPENFDSLLPRRVPRIIRIHDKLYGAKYQSTGCTTNVKDDVIETGLNWWTTELERAENFLKTETWRNQEFGRERPSLRVVLETLEDMVPHLF